jgi:hypothetical protein
MKSKAITPELFNAGIIELHTTRKSLIKSMRKAGIPCDDDYLTDVIGACVHDYLESNSVMYIYVGDGKLTSLIHELFHATIRYLAYVGVPVQTNEANETYAYFIEYLTREFSPLL